MNKKKVLVSFLLAAGMLSGLLISPLPGQAVSAAPPAQNITNIEVHFVTRPPEMMCIDDTAPITFTYTITSDYAQYGGSGNGKPGKASITATTTLGTLSKTSWALNATMSTGTITAIYKGKKAGEEALTFTATSGSMKGQTTFHFDVAKCDKTIIIMGDDYESGANGGFSSMIYGKGGIQTDEMGVVMGGGSYQYLLGVQFTAPDKTFTCDKFVQNSTDSTFIAFGKAPDKGIEIGLQFKAFDTADLVAHCVDKEGKRLTYKVLKGTHIDLNPSLNLGTLSFSTGSGYISFKFGKGAGEVYLIKRKGGKK